jgi:hypothetical protein
MKTNKKEYAKQKSKEAAERNKKKNENRTTYGEKRCPKCKTKKQPEFFTKDKTTKDGLYAICKVCRKIKRKERYEKDYDVMKQRLQNMTGGIYIIKNKKENKIYVGQSIMIEQRRTQHFTDLRGKRHPNKQLQEDFTRLGEESFEHQVYKELEKDFILLNEEEWKTMRKFRDNGWSLYNSEEK